MDGSILYLIGALIAVVIAWKVLKGVVKTVALLVILAIAAFLVFGGFA